jgi:hypothetical protein
LKIIRTIGPENKKENNWQEFSQKKEISGL